MPRLTKISTKKGDKGMTSLSSRQRVSKDTLRVHAFGSVDELNSFIGLALSSGLSDRLSETLPAIQNQLFNLGADLSYLPDEDERIAMPRVEDRHIAELNALVDELEEFAGPLENFILPGGSPGSAYLHVARTVCRRAERETVALNHEEPVDPNVLAYLNRLSDALFLMARYENIRKGVSEPLWNSSI